MSSTGDCLVSSQIVQVRKYREIPKQYCPVRAAGGPAEYATTQCSTTSVKSLVELATISLLSNQEKIESFANLPWDPIGHHIDKSMYEHRVLPTARLLGAMFSEYPEWYGSDISFIRLVAQSDDQLFLALPMLKSPKLALPLQKWLLHLDLSESRLQDYLIPSLSHLEAVTWLDLGGTQITNEGAMGLLRYIDYNRKALDTPCLRNLRYLGLHRTAVDAAVLPYIFRNKSLMEVQTWNMDEQEFIDRGWAGFYYASSLDTFAQNPIASPMHLPLPNQQLNTLRLQSATYWPDEDFIQSCNLLYYCMLQIPLRTGFTPKRRVADIRNKTIRWFRLSMFRELPPIMSHAQHSHEPVRLGTAARIEEKPCINIQFGQRPTETALMDSLSAHMSSEATAHPSRRDRSPAPSPSKRPNISSYFSSASREKPQVEQPPLSYFRSVTFPPSKPLDKPLDKPAQPPKERSILTAKSPFAAIPLQHTPSRQAQAGIFNVPKGISLLGKRKK
ncbi:hypothetical protein DFS34DRAFT_271989 [Phlyctochytrium arcticum]|nr:hypothetical protein DFS34DRAFT_271989 [Phlyctochytrium arcticum]